MLRRLTGMVVLVALLLASCTGNVSAFSTPAAGSRQPSTCYWNSQKIYPFPLTTMTITTITSLGSTKEAKVTTEKTVTASSDDSILADLFNNSGASSENDQDHDDEGVEDNMMMTTMMNDQEMLDVIIESPVGSLGVEEIKFLLVFDRS